MWLRLSGTLDSEPPPFSLGRCWPWAHGRKLTAAGEHQLELTRVHTSATGRQVAQSCSRLGFLDLEMGLGEGWPGPWAADCTAVSRPVLRPVARQMEEQSRAARKTGPEAMARASRTLDGTSTGTRAGKRQDTQTPGQGVTAWPTGGLRATSCLASQWKCLKVAALLKDQNHWTPSPWILAVPGLTDLIALA